MTLGGWIIMLLSVGGTTGWAIWCVCRVLSKPKSAGKLHGQMDIHLPDQDR
ncbi:MAG TPA: hypothetical protein VIS74_04020 [Chthoniobacterales bacterium]